MRRLVVDDEHDRLVPVATGAQLYRRTPDRRRDRSPVGNEKGHGPRATRACTGRDEASDATLPTPTPQFRRRAWRTFQRALDPLGAAAAAAYAATAALSRASVFSRPSSSMLSNRPGETFEPVTATRIGWKPCRGFRPSRSATPRSAASIASAVNGSTLGERRRAPPRARRAAVELGRIGLDVVEEEAGERGELAEPRDLLLHERRRLARRAPRPSRSPARRARATSACGVARPAAARAGTRRSSSRASRSRTAPGSTPTRSSVKRSTSSSRLMIVVSPSGAQPSSARKFISASGR